MRHQGFGKITSFDHDAEWAQLTRSKIVKHGLEEHGEVVVAPLKKVDSNSSHHWYDTGERLAALSEIDLLIVDGPPAGNTGNAKSRLPAVPKLLNNMSSNCVVVLDDAARNGEKQIVEEWLKLLPGYRVRIASSATGLAILERKRSDTSERSVADSAKSDIHQSQHCNAE